VIADAREVVEEIRMSVRLDDYVIPARRPSDPPWNTRWREYLDKPSSPQSIWRQVAQIAARAGIAAHIHPHLLRHAYGDHATG
jgi:site-specific recombinase XerC